MLTQREAEILIAMKKMFVATQNPVVLNESFDEKFVLISENKQEHFILDVKQGRIDLSKLRYQNRYEETIPLVRFDSTGIHENPDGTKINGAHIHIYREGYADKFAVQASDFLDSRNLLDVLKKFCDYCNIEQKRFAYQSINSSAKGGKRK